MIEKKYRKKKLENISLMKTVMMIGVVLYHSLLFFGGTWFTPIGPTYNAKYLYELALWLNTFLVQTFTMASGFLFYYLNDGDENHWEKIKKRAKRLLIPYFSTLVFWVAPIGIAVFNYAPNEFINKYVLAQSPNQLWFLLMLFWVFVFFELIGKKIKISLKNLIIIYLAATIISGFLHYIHFDYFQISKAIQYILYFYTGGYLYKNKNKIKNNIGIVMLIVAMLLYIITRFLDASSNPHLSYISYIIIPAVSILEIIPIYLLCTKLAKSLKKQKSVIYTTLETNSFGIYLFHQQIIYFAIIYLNGNVHPIIQVTLSFIASIGISLLIVTLLKKAKKTRFMFGV